MKNSRPASAAGTRLIQLTPPGRGAVATLRLEGAGAAEALGKRVRLPGEKRLGDLPVGRVTFGRFLLESGVDEEIVLRRYADDAFDLHCHGGQAAVASIAQGLGGRHVAWVPWRGWADEARIALADARTERAAAILLDQLQGALARAVAEIQQQLGRQRVDEARQGLRTLLDRAEFGRHLLEPWKVAIAGAPNVGKSSLLNAILGYSRAIVHATPGTTRDVVAATTAIDGYAVEFRDTAGVRESQHPVEQMGVALAYQEVATADLAILVFDLTRPWSADDQQLLESRPDALVVHNKADAAAAMAEPVDRPQGARVSALTGDGIETLLARIVERLVPQPLPTGAAVPFTQRQTAVLRASYEAAIRGDSEEARALLRMGEEEIGNTEYGIRNDE
jgi:tRNA modification GTPase